MTITTNLTDEISMPTKLYNSLADLGFSYYATPQAVEFHHSKNDLYLYVYPDDRPKDQLKFGLCHFSGDMSFSVENVKFLLYTIKGIIEDDNLKNFYIVSNFLEITKEEYLTDEILTHFKASKQRLTLFNVQVFYLVLKGLDLENAQKVLNLVHSTSEEENKVIAFFIKNYEL